MHIVSAISNVRGKHSLPINIDNIDNVYGQYLLKNRNDVKKPDVLTILSIV